MADGRVTATSLNLRDAPNGAVIGLLQNGDLVTIVGQQDSWLSISGTVGGVSKSGWVRAQFVATGASAPPAPDTAANPVTVANGRAIGPDGRPFARAQGPGFATRGLTSLDDWLKTNPIGIQLSPSVVRVIRAVSLNEGLLEAINSYDNAFFSFGMFQWTAGSDDDPGELAALLALVKQTNPGAFQTYFEPFGLMTNISANATTGFLALNGRELRSAASKGALRAVEWAYRFWRAGQDDKIRACQVSLAASRISRFIHLPLAGHTVLDWVSSEYGVALVLDEHVNRPGHVPKTLDAAVTTLGGNPDPSQWGDAEEHHLLDLYIDARDITSMTDSAGRATNIADCVHSGSLSDKRGSFAVTGA